MHSIFGTDGIRGVFKKDITYSLAAKVGYALGTMLETDNPVVIGRDTRISGDLLSEALTIGLNSANKRVVDIGVCPTPAIPFLIRNQNFSSGIMISASHNPPEYNGIKIFDANGIKLNKKSENKLEDKLKKINKNNLLRKRQDYQKKIELLQLYEQSLIDSIGQCNLSGIKIILDTCHGSASICAEKIFKKLGADICVINKKPDGSRINVNCGSTCLYPLKKAIEELNADMGFSFDGDADRVIGIDSEGNTLDGDHILFLWGRELLRESKLFKNIIISTVMANLSFENTWKKIGGVFIRTPVGDKFIHNEIIKNQADLGGEQSGHILSKINNFSGDGILTAIQISKFCKMQKIHLKDWLRTSFEAFPQQLTNIKLQSNKNYSIKSVEENINHAIAEKLNTISEPCRIFVRHSGTEPILRILVEAENKELVSECTIQISKDIEHIMNKLKYI